MGDLSKLERHRLARSGAWPAKLGFALGMRNMYLALLFRLIQVKMPEVTNKAIRKTPESP